MPVRCAARVLECARELVLTQLRACAVAVARSPGDNLHNSTDSRYYGPVPRAMLKGVVFARAWPPSAAGWVESKQVHGHLVVDDGEEGGLGAGGRAPRRGEGGRGHDYVARTRARAASLCALHTRARAHTHLYVR